MHVCVWVCVSLSLNTICCCCATGGATQKDDGHARGVKRCASTAAYDANRGSTVSCTHTYRYGYR